MEIVVRKFRMKQDWKIQNLPSKGGNKSHRFIIFATDLQGKQVKASAASTMTKSLPIRFSILVNYSL